MSKIHSHLLVLGLMLFALPFLLGQEKANPPPKGFLTGRVTSETGEPLAGVMVIRESGKIDTTDANGGYYSSVQFNDKRCCGIRFSLPGFKTLTKGVNPDVHRLDVVLQSGDNMWVPSICESPPEGKKRIGWKMKLLIPEGTRVEENIGDDTSCWEIFFGYEKDHEKMMICSGLMWEGILPPKDLLMSSSVMQERYNPDRLAFDYRGSDKEGNRWRFTGWFSETIEYRNISGQAANFFDSIVDNLCWAASAWPKDK